MRLFVGLGNPGAKYERNRHNIGFLAMDAIARRHGFSPWRRRFQGETADGALGGDKVILLKPSTYMNESGRAVGEAANFFKLGVDAIDVFHDEIELPPAKLRVKVGGGIAGHNGLRSISRACRQRVSPRAHRRRSSGRQGNGARACAERILPRRKQPWVEAMLDAIADNAAMLIEGTRFEFPEQDSPGAAGEGRGWRRTDIESFVIASEAKQSRAKNERLDCFVADAPRNDG